MKVVVTGATGFIGQRLCKRLWRGSHQVSALTRDIGIGAAVMGPLVQTFGWGPKSPPEWKQVVAEADAVIHLAGESLAAHKWSTEVKRRIRLSRVESTRMIVEALTRPGSHVKTLLSASAVGYYGDCGDEELTEQSRAGTGFVAEVCKQWEEEAHHAESSGVRVVCLRFGVALGESGALTRILYPSSIPISPWKLGLGGPIGAGRQWMSWIHIDDAAAMITWAMEQEAVSGPLNVTSPKPVRNSEFAKALGRALHRPAALRVPAFVVRSQLGEMASVVLSSQKALPAVAASADFHFRHPDLDETLTSILTSIEQAAA